MPIYWTIDSRAQLVSVVAEGDVSLDEVMTFLRAVAGADAISYRKLFDGRAAVPNIRPDELLSLCVKIRSYHENGLMGALALVATAEQTVAFSRLLGALASAERPIKVFESPRAARNWIEGPAAKPR